MLVIETKRLLIRPYRFEDVHEIVSMFQDQEVMEFMPNGTDKTLRDTEMRIANYINHYSVYGYSKYVLMDKGTKQLIGDCGICRIEHSEINELGYRVKKEFWNQGFATEAANAIIGYAFNDLKFTELNALVERQNTKSIYILENKLGFKSDGQLFCYGKNFEWYRLDHSWTSQ